MNIGNAYKQAHNAITQYNNGNIKAVAAIALL